jgi:large subunit ribosomal protein L18
MVMAKPKGDENLVSAHSRELAKKYGWMASTGNVPAAYLTGLLCGLKAKSKGVEEAILDIGLNSPSKGARIFAVLKGASDAGILIPHSEDKLPDDKRMTGEHIAQYATSLASNPEAYQSRFSKYIKQNLSPESFSQHFEKTKKDLLAAFKSGSAKP